MRQRHRQRARRRIGVAAALLFIAGACSGPTVPSATGRLSVVLTDAPIAEITSMNVYMEGKKIKDFGPFRVGQGGATTPTLDFEPANHRDSSGTATG